MKSLKNRIYMQNGIIIITIVFLLESTFLWGIWNYYMNSAEYELLNKAKISGSFYNRYLVDDSIEEKARYILENDSKQEHIYMQVFDVNKIMLTDSYGFYDKQPHGSKDLLLGLQGKTQLMKMKKSEEAIIAISVPLYDKRKNILGAVRYSTSTEDIKKVIGKITRILFFIGNGVIIITFLLSSFLARRIVNPIEELTNVAGKMAKGDFSYGSVKKYDDEIGNLSDTLNYMAGEIVKSNKVKNEFISSVSHELRTPLTAIKGWSEIMLTGEVTSLEEAKEGLKIISDETDRLKGLVEDLLDFSRFEAKRVTLELEKININYLINEVGSYFKKRIEKEGIKLHVNIGQELYWINGDKNRLKQVFINIMDNAVKFSKHNGIIKIHTYKKENKVFIEIEDDGIGIPKEDIEKVMDKFYKGKAKESGSGIGLAVCKEIISMHGGNLVIESEENKGTKVTIEILTTL
ncbi:HAMP domain-containing sensor histidine kinase [Crassaminicella profunda]|uniref:HAMP domain-containing sensor histidine kinase n=1 Tax=Crassaminicella profunda TaxID=1286698 RepID=UPI001CA740FD|nr:ATP-binding protein [Crassaminicella profunda]QZY55186.1 cell wall metabolism sensor histidine kinase WalK [Crassaminicella profunda]